MPIATWLFVSFLVLFAFRLIHVLCIPEEDEDERYETWCFGMYTGETPLVHSILITFVLYPFFLCWVLLGSVWFSTVSIEPHCYPKSEEYWYVLLWLLIFYIWLVTYTTAIITSVLVYVPFPQVRKQEVDQDFARLLDQYAPQSPPQFPRSSIWDFEGLSPRSLANYSPHQVTTEELGAFHCSVCTEEVRAGERVRKLDCNHSFHMACIDVWLLQHTECPNCKRDLRRRRGSGLYEPLLPGV